MSHWLENTPHRPEVGATLTAGRADPLFHGWQPSDVIVKLYAGAERWQAAIRQIRTTVNLVEILRGRTII